MPLNHNAKKLKSYMLIFILAFGAPAFYAEWRTIQLQLAGLETIDSEILGAQQILKLVTPLKDKIQVDNRFLAELRTAGDTSTLILDPREDTYYWVDTIINFFPDAISATPEQLSFLLKRQEHAFSKMWNKCSTDCSPLAVEANATIDAIRGQDLKGNSLGSAKSAWMRSTLVLHQLLTKYSELEKAKIRAALLILGILLLLSTLTIGKVLSSALANIEALDLERAKSLQNAKMASLGEMSAGVAHEINNPLAIISGSVGLLSKFKDNPEKLAAKVEAIQKSCNRIARIVNSLRKFSRSGDKSSFQTSEMSKIVREALVLTETKSKRHSTPVTVNCNTDSHVDCNEVEIEQVLVNLINNAIDAVKTNPEKWVKITLFENAESIVLRVMDSGPGIPENVRAKLFDPFFTTKKVGEGTGLGLSITKGILDEHKATITVVAECPNTCFEIRFPKAEEMKNAA